LREFFDPRIDAVSNRPQDRRPLAGGRACPARERGLGCLDGRCSFGLAAARYLGDRLLVDRRYGGGPAWALNPLPAHPVPGINLDARYARLVCLAHYPPTGRRDANGPNPLNPWWGCSATRGSAGGRCAAREDSAEP